MRIYSKLPIGEFSALGAGHVLATADTAPGPLALGTKLQLICMFSVWELNQGGTRIGFYFESGFTVQNKNAFLLTFMESKRGQAKSSNLVLRDDQSGLIVIDYEGVGAIAISTKVSKFVREILESQ